MIVDASRSRGRWTVSRGGRYSVVVVCGVALGARIGVPSPTMWVAAMAFVAILVGVLQQGLP